MSPNRADTDRLTRILLLDTKMLEFWTSLVVIIWSVAFFIEDHASTESYTPLFSYQWIGYSLLAIIFVAGLNVMRGVLACFRDSVDSTKAINVRYFWARVSLFSWTILGGYMLTVSPYFSDAVNFLFMSWVELWIFIHLLWVRKTREHIQDQLHPGD